MITVSVWFFGARCFGFLESPYERDCYLVAPLESPKKQTAPKGINLNCQCWAGRGQWL